jgi:hypothetical protein
MPGPGARGQRWLIRDTQRLLARAKASNRGPITVDELRYLSNQCVLLLHGPLALDDYDRAQVEQLHRYVLAALGERGAEQVEAP